MRAWRQIGATALAIFVATGLPSRASAEPEHIRIQFSAPRKCPDGAAFVRALRQRTGRFQLASGAEQTRVFVVTIAAADPLVAGRLEIQGPATEVSVRDVSGKTCDEVMEALALMTALAVDPSAQSAGRIANVPSTSAPPAIAPAPTGAANRTPRPKATETSPLSPPASAQLAAVPATSSATGERHDSEALPSGPAPPPALPPPVTVEAPATKPSPAVAMGWKWAAGVQASGSLHVSPTLGFGGLLFVEATAPGTAVLGPVLRAGLFVSQSDASVASGAGAGFQWAAAMVEGCPIRLIALDSRVGFFPCLAFHLGVLHGQGRHLDQSDETTDLWADFGPVARIRVVVLARLFLEVQGMLVFPLRRVTFDVQDRGPTEAPTTVFAVPLVGVLAGIGVGYQFE